jgi:aspartyl/asparaginyl beta-hydroxylase (cupin superfamily)
MTRIRWHRGFEEYSPYVTRCHVGLDVPERCSLNTLSHVLQMRTGHAIGFNDYDDHEAVNLSLDKTRVVLILDISDPERLAMMPQTFSEIQDEELRAQIMRVVVEK